jgi:phospholipid/cholesterol/gamma-HCH transport system permease protein
MDQQLRGRDPCLVGASADRGVTFEEWLKSALLEVQEYDVWSGSSSARSSRSPFYFRDVIEQFDAIGFRLADSRAADGMFTGHGARAPVGLHARPVRRPGLMVGRWSASILKELGPVLTGLMVAGASARASPRSWAR